MINYTLNRSNRKTVGIYIRNGMVEVRAPLKYSQAEIDKFVTSKEKWIRDKLASSQEQTERMNAFALDYGSKIYYRGKLYPIEARPGKLAGFDGTCFYMPLNLEPPHIKNLCIQIYRNLAKKYLTAKVAEFAPQMGVMPVSVKINNAKTRWGSCSSKKSLNFSWRLIMGDDDVIDYVVVHELAHLSQMNHSAAFWAIVKNILPDYKQRRAKLKELHRRLAEESWD